MTKKKWSRIIAMLLAVMLVFCDSNVIYAVESTVEAQTEDPAAAQAAADAEAARQAAEVQAAADAEAARQAAEAQAAADAEAARQAAEAQAAADAEAARQAAEAQAAADAAAAQQASEAQAAADAEAARQAAEAQAAAQQATETQAATDAETGPQNTPSATGSLTLKTEAASTQKDGEPAKLKVTYELSADSSVDTVETRLYAWNKNAGYPQFTDGKFTDPETKREFQLKTDKDGYVYVEYLLKKGESFTEEFQFTDTALEAGTKITFDVAIGANGTVPANCSIQSATAKVTYALPDENGTATEVETESNAPESTTVENTVAFQSAEGATVTVDGADVTNGTAMARDGKIVFTVTPAEGYKVTDILVDGTIPARTNDETPETNDYIIEGIQTDSTVVVISTQAVVIETESETESETTTEAATEVETETESETEAVTETETVAETESESETETVAETETESETIVETESETEAVTETEVETESETEEVKTQEAKDGKGIAVYGAEVSLKDFLINATIMTSDGNPYNPDDTMANNGWFILNLEFQENGTAKQLPVYNPETGQTLVVYKMPEGIAKLDPSTGNQLKTEDGTLVGEYDVEADGSIKIRFNEKINNSSTAKGWITVRAQFDRDSVKTDEKFEIDFGGTAKVTVKLTDGGTLAANKSASAYDKETGSFTFTITLDADADVSNALIEDKLGDSLELIADSIELDDAKTGFSTDTTANPFKVTIPSLTKGEHKLTYKAKIKDDVLLNYNGEIPGLDNSADISAEDKTIHVKGDASYSHTWLEKSNSGVDKDGKITWTVKLNPEGDQSVAGLVVKDKITGKINYDKSQPIQVNPAINGKTTISWDEVTMGNDGKSWSYKMPENAGKEAYTFTYVTSSEAVDKTTNAYNTVTVNRKFPAKSDVTLQPGTGNGTGKVTKTYGTVEVEEDGKYVPWEATLTIPAGTYKKGEITYIDTLYGTHEFANPLSADAQNKYQKIEVVKKDGTTLEVNVSEQDKDSFKLSFPALTLSEALTVTIKYYSKVQENGTLYNVGELSSNGKLSSGSANTTVRDDKFDKEGSYDSTTDEITWKVTVNQEGNTFTKGYVSIEDILPSSQEYVEGSAYYTIGDEESPCYDVDLTNDGSGIIIRLGTIDATTKAIYVTYKTRTKAGENRGETIEAKNVAKIKINGKEAGSADTTVKIPSNVFDKMLIKNPDAWTDTNHTTKDYVAGFELVVNEGNATLLSGSNSAVYTIKDKMSSTMTLDVKSIVVKDGSGNVIGTEAISGPYYTVQYNDAAHEFTLEIHNPEANANHTYYITYQATVQVGAGVGDVSWDNSADFTAGSVKKDSSQEGTVKKTQTTEGGITLGKTYISVYKYDRKTSSALERAVFVLERYNEGKKLWEVMQEVTTVADGVAYFGQSPDVVTADPKLQLDSGVKYRFYEKTAPDGYLLIPGYEYFQIEGKNTFVDPEQDYPVKQLNSSTAAFQMPNTAKMSVSATKTWDDADDQDGKRPDEITVTLKANWQDAKVTTAPTLVNGEVVTGKNNQVKLKADTSGSWKDTKVTWTDLPKVDDNGNEITYTVEESWFSNDYSISYKYPNKDVWGVKGQDGTVTITNTHKTEKVDKTVTKKWEDANNQDGLRKNVNAYVCLFADGEQVIKDKDGNPITAIRKVGTEDTWTFKWSNLPKYKNGKEINYTVKEGTCTTDGKFTEFTKASLEKLGYTSKVDKETLTVTNTHNPATEKLKVVKAWSGNDKTNDDGNRPASIKVKLQKTTDKTTDSSKEANWKDAESDEVELNADNSWSYTWENLPSYESGKKLSYRVQETVPSHYEVSYGEVQEIENVPTITVTNTYKPTKINVEATKYWNDESNKDQKRPESIQFQLEKSSDKKNTWEKVGEPQILKGTENIWEKATWSDLLTYEKGKKIYYRVVELENENVKNNYSTNSPQEVPEGDGTVAVTITNTRATTTEFQPVIYKELLGNRKLTNGKTFSAGEFEFVLKDKDGKTLQKKGVDADGKVIFDELSYEKAGTYTYTISEVVPADSKKKVPGVTYSTATVKMEVEVAPDEAGTKLETSVTYKVSSGTGATVTKGKDIEDTKVTFTNTYKAGGQSLITGTKTVKNITGSVPAFNFALYDKDGNMVTYKDANGTAQTCMASNGTDGKFTINTPYYTQDDIKNSPYTYYLKEVIPEDATADNDYTSGNYKYDTASYTITVAVSDKGDGTLNVIPSVGDGSTVSFTNTYNAEGGLSISVQKEVVSATDGETQLAVPTDKSFEFVLYEGTDSEHRNTKKETITSPENGTVSAFSNISYSADDIGKTFYYQVRETEDLNKKWYSYSTDYYDIDVKVEDGGEGKLSITKTIYKNGSETPWKVDESDAPLAFVFTNKYEATGMIPLTLTKTLTGKNLTDGMFTFELYEVDDSGEENGVYTVENGKAVRNINTVAGENGVLSSTVTFPELTFTENQLGEHRYVIKEVPREGGTSEIDETDYGYFYANDVNVVVTVSEGEAGANGRNGSLAVTASYDGDSECTLENKYTAKGSTTLTVDKILEGRDLNDEATKDFTFVLTSAKGTPEASQSSAAVDKATGKAVFNLEYTEKDAGKTYTYTLKEVDAKEEGYRYDTAEYTVVVTITDNDNGTLTVTKVVKDAEGKELEDDKGEEKNPSFTNSYEATNKLKLTGAKKVIGKDATGETFTFALLNEYSILKTDEKGKILSVENEVSKETVTVDGTTGTITFPEITYTKNKDIDETGTYTYRIVEIPGEDTGYTYDSTVYTVTVKVSDPGTGKLTVEKTISGGEEIIFNNTYAASGSTVLQAKKELTGRSLENGQFTFLLKDKDGKVIDTQKNSGSEVTLGSDVLKYTQTDIGKTYRYTMEEVSDADMTEKRYEFSKVVYTAFVTIKDGKNGSVTPEIKYYKGNISADEAKTTTEVKPEEVVFENSYTAIGSITLNGIKHLDYKNLKDEQFTFQLLDENKEEIQTTVNKDGKFSFDLSYDQDSLAVKDKDGNTVGYVDTAKGKDFIYYVKEKATDPDYYNYCDWIYKVTVNVKDKGDGNLAVTKNAEVVGGSNMDRADADNLIFVNKYTPTGSVTLPIEKLLTGRSLSDEGTPEFSFVLQGDGQYQKITNNNKGKGEFKVSYNEKDINQTYHYTVSEVDDHKDGYSYDSTVYNVTVYVKDNGEGKLIPEFTIHKNGEEKAYTDNAMTFSNKYEAGGSLELTAKKVLSGRTLEEGQFHFILQGDNIATQIKANDKDGNVVFDEIPYSQKDDGNTYHYTIYEAEAASQTKADGYTYDTTIYNITVKVTDLGNGKLDIAKTILSVKDGKEESVTGDMVFNNSYEADGKASVTAEKVLNGRALSSKQFSFSLDSTGDAPEVHQVKFNDKNGNIVFDTLNYTHEDAGKTYTYLLREVIPDQKKDEYTYDEQVYHVKVTVSEADKENGNGKLETVTKIYKITGIAGDPKEEEVEKAVFENTYKAAGEFTPTAEKKLTGHDLAAGQFTFSLDSVGTETPEVHETVTNDADGKITFSKLNFTEADVNKTYTYELKEAIPAVKEKGYSYDTTVYVMNIFVKDNGYGNLTPEMSMSQKVDGSEELAPVDKAVFTNTYSAEGGITLTASKAYAEGVEKGLLANQFLFTVSENGNTVATGSNALDGKITFTEIKYKLTPGDTSVLGEHTYTVKETRGTDGAVLYDGTEYTVKVKVTDNGNGTLKAEVVGDTKEADLKFVNDLTKVKISKIDATNQAELPGAKLEIRDADGEVIDSWISGNEPHYIEGVLKAGQKYTLTETAVPNGYKYAEEITFEVGKDGKVQTVTMKDAPSQLTVSKKDLTDLTKDLPGATFEVQDENGDVVRTVYNETLRWTTTADALVKTIIGLKDGSYQLVETKAPTGYTIAKPISFTVKEGKIYRTVENELAEIDSIAMEDLATEVVISKTDITTAKELPGATLQVLKKVTGEDGAETEEVVTTIYGEKLEWVSGETPKTVRGLPAGEYILRETKAPTGFAVAADVKFTVSDDLTVENKVVMKDAPTDVIISKVALSNETRELPGAALEILNENGEIAKTVYGEQLSWISDVTAKAIKGLPAGTYTLRETAAPDGYALAEDVTFTVNTDGTTTKVVMKDDVTRVQISKMDVTNNKELAGAHLALKDASGEIILSWISTGEPKVFEGKLIAGATYTLTEISAPSGYSLAKDITFTVNSNNEIQKIVMDDKVASGDASVIVQKLVKYKDQYKTIDDYTFYTALFADEACTQRVSSVKALRVQQSYTTSTIFTNLEYGTYYVAETDEFGNPVSESFVIDSNEILDGKVSLTPKSQMGKSTIINYVNGNLPENPHNDGKITVNKQVLIGTEPGNVTDTFYFALFVDAAHTVLASAGIQSLELNDESSGTVIFDKLPYGEYYLAETDENGKPVGSDFDYTVTLDASYCKISSDSTAVERTITNSKKKEPDTEPVTEPTTTPTTTPTTNPPTTNPPTNTTTTTTTTPKTGDDTNIAFYLTLMMMAALVGAGCAVRRRKKKEQR